MVLASSALMLGYLTFRNRTLNMSLRTRTVLGTSITVGIVGAALGAMLTGPRVTTVDGTKSKTTMPLWTNIAGACAMLMGFFILYVFVRVLPKMAA